MDKTFYRQHLPHIQPEGFSFFVTFRLANSIPKSQLLKIKTKFQEEVLKLNRIEGVKERNRALFDLRKIYIAKYDAVMDNIKTGPHYFKIDEVAKIVADQMHRFDGELYDLIAYSIMSNHVHMLISTDVQFRELEKIKDFGYTQLHKIMNAIKGASARYCNLELNRSGKFWEQESYDIYIRNEIMFGKVISYILNNPVKAGLVDNWEDYKWNYKRNGQLPLGD